MRWLLHTVVLQCHWCPCPHADAISSCFLSIFCPIRTVRSVCSVITYVWSRYLTPILSIIFIGTFWALCFQHFFFPPRKKCWEKSAAITSQASSGLKISETVTNHAGLKRTRNYSYIDHTRSIMARTGPMQFCEICHNRDILQLGITLFYRSLNHGVSAKAPPYYECKNCDKIDNVLHGTWPKWYQIGDINR